MFNPTLSAVNTMIPGLLATILLISMMSIMAQAVVRERERGTLEQMFVTPIGRGDYLFGKVTPYVIVAIGQMILVTLVGRYWFRVPFNGQIPVVAVGLLLFMFTGIGLGSAGVAGLEDPSAGAADGHVHPDPDDGAVRASSSRSSRCPRPSCPLTYFIPLRYALAVLRGAFIKGSGFSALAVPMLAMAAFSIVIFSIAVLSFSKRLSD